MNCNIISLATNLHDTCWHRRIQLSAVWHMKHDNCQLVKKSHFNLPHLYLAPLVG